MLWMMVPPGLAHGGGEDDLDRLPVGVQPDGRIVVPSNQVLRPAGQQIAFPGRPVDLAFADDAKTLVVKNQRDLVFIDVATLRIKQTLPLPKKGDPRPGFSAVGLLVEDGKVFATDAQSSVRVAAHDSGGSYAWQASIELPSPSVKGLPYPTGIVRQSAPHPRAANDWQDRVWVASSRGNCLLLFNMATGRLENEVPVGVCPYAICRFAPDRYYVSNWGGDPPKPKDPQDISSGTPVRVDPKNGVASSGTVSVIAKVSG